MQNSASVFNSNRLTNHTVIAKNKLPYTFNQPRCTTVDIITPGEVQIRCGRCLDMCILVAWALAVYAGQWMSIGTQYEFNTCA